MIRVLVVDDQPVIMLAAADADGHPGEALRPGAGRRPAPAPAPAPGTGLGSLTGREREVLEHLARGETNAEISASLFITEETTKTHVRRVFRKLGLRDRVHAVVFGYETGLVTPGRVNAARSAG